MKTEGAHLCKIVKLSDFGFSFTVIKDKSKNWGAPS